MPGPRLRTVGGVSCLTDDGLEVQFDKYYQDYKPKVNAYFKERRAAGNNAYNSSIDRFTDSKALILEKHVE